MQSLVWTFAVVPLSTFSPAVDLSFLFNERCLQGP